MFLPKEYEKKELSLLQGLIKKYPFGILISAFENKINSVGLPCIGMINKDKSFEIWTHLATENKILNTLQQNGNKATLIFQGPNGYISPLLYKTAKKIPTWNYIMAELQVDCEIVIKAEEKINIQEETIKEFDSLYLNHFQNQIDKEYLEKITPYFTGLKLNISSFELNYKLSQDKPIEDIQSVIEHLLDSPHQNLNLLGNEMIKHSLLP